MTPLKLSFSLLVATLTACSTIPDPLPAPDITEERLHLHIADDCNLDKLEGGLWLVCKNEPAFMVNDDCEIVIENKERILNCGE